MIKVGIVGATGYTGLELIKLLLNHPKFHIQYLASSEGGERIEQIYPALQGVFECTLQKADPKEAAAACELLFLALPHKTSMDFASKLLDEGVKVVDLSADYRLKKEHYEAFYTTHTDTKHLAMAVYGLPEIFRSSIEKASLVANPGCYPTAALLSLLPFAPYIDPLYPVMIDAKSGLSGAGKKCSQKSHFVHIDENIHAYNPIKHRHSIEIKEKLEIVGGEIYEINFVPHLIPVVRGMLVNSFVLLKEDIDPLEVLKDFYANEPFVRIKEDPVDIKSVAGTHFCDIFAIKNQRTLFLGAAIDNLLRGASSQALVNANIMMGFEEDLGVPKIAYIP